MVFHMLGARQDWKQIQKAGPSQFLICCFVHICIFCSQGHMAGQDVHSSWASNSQGLTTGSELPPLTKSHELDTEWPGCHTWSRLAANMRKDVKLYKMARD